MFCIRLSTALLTNALLAVSLSAQWVPVSAQVQETQYRLNPDGSRLILKDLRGTYVRASDGSARTILQNFSNGTPSNIGEEIVLDIPNRQILRVYLDSKSYKIIGSVAVPYLPRIRSHVPQNIREQTIDGLQCRGLPVKGATVQSGTAWFSFENDLKVREETQFTHGLHYVYELKNIQLGTEPLRSAFRIPTSFIKQ